ncbi:DNA-binding beta-propeller fold protein YncE [Pedobacter sp. UYP30]|uniref:YncE family protein n=1 Tax=Pedobacter sp. UYP30 TaxID=1756400 RepID=UPI003392CF2F
MKKIFSILALVVSLAATGTSAKAQGQFTLDKTISLPGDGGYDYLYLNEPTRTLYVSHGTMVHAIDLKTEKLIGTISGMAGVHGIAIVNHLNLGFISDGRANAIIAFDTKTLKIIKSIPISGKGPDAIMYDSFSKKIFAFCGDSNNASVVDPQTLTQTGTVDLGGAPEFAVADGKGLIYNNLEDKSHLDVINAKTLKVIENYDLAPCGGPTGMALDLKNNRLITACRENKGLSIVDISTGKVLQTLPIGAGVDAVEYDAINKLVFVSNGDGTATIFKQESPDKYKLFQTLNTQYRAKTMALDPLTHKIYFSVASFEKGTRKTLPNSFKLLVYKSK